MPRIGLLSDSHGRASTTRRGVEVLLGQNVDVLLHLGDVGTVDVLDALAVARPDSGEQIETHVVFGNTDWDRDALQEYARDLDIGVDDPVGHLHLERGELVFCHGDDAAALTRALADHVRYLCHGHTHRQLDQRVDGTRIINPGALFRAREYTVAVLDTAGDALSFHRVDGP